MEMKFFGPIETKLFNFFSILINEGRGGRLSGPTEPPLDPPLLFVVSCQVQRCYHMLFYNIGYAQVKIIHTIHWSNSYIVRGLNASSFITFFTYLLRQNVIPFWKELFVAFKMARNIKKHSLYVSSYRRLYKSHSCILKFF